MSAGQLSLNPLDQRRYVNWQEEEPKEPGPSTLLVHTCEYS